MAYTEHPAAQKLADWRTCKTLWSGWMCHEAVESGWNAKEAEAAKKPYIEAFMEYQEKYKEFFNPEIEPK